MTAFVAKTAPFRADLQYPNGRKGIYELLLVEKKAMTIRDFKDMAETEKCDMPAQLKVEGAASNWTP